VRDSFPRIPVMTTQDTRPTAPDVKNQYDECARLILAGNLQHDGQGARAKELADVQTGMDSRLRGEAPLALD